MREFMFDHILWVYGLFASMIGGSFIFMDKTKQNKGTCDALHTASGQRLDSMDKKLDLLISLHLRDNGK